MSEPITILLVDDHTIVRQGVRTLLDMHPDLHMVGDAENAEVALSLVEELVPDVVLFGPGVTGHERRGSDPPDEASQSTNPNCGSYFLR